jgi:ABC-type branched-subunit amino acid transport system substrate-binding protein
MRHRDLRDGAVAASQYRRAAAATLLAACCLFATTTVTADPDIAADLTPAQERGKYIYEAGRSRSRRVITADLQRGQGPAPASILPCINCHGADGRGADDYEGIAPLDINWYALSGAGEHQHSQRSHAAFDERTFARAVSDGVDPNGNELDLSMPRYNVADEDMADLIAYLKVMDSQFDPGLSGTSVRLGTVLPLDGKLAGLGLAMKSVLEAYFAKVNAAGGIHGRRLELVVGPWSDTQDPLIWAARDLVDNEPLFALVSGYVPNYDAELEALANEKKLPLVGPYTALPPDGDADDSTVPRRYAFYATAGLRQQVQALVKAAISGYDARDRRLAIVYPRVQFYDELAAAGRRYALSLGFGDVTVKSYPYEAFDAAGTVSSLAEARTDVVLFLGSAGELLELGNAAATTQWFPHLLAPALLAQQRVFDLPKSFSGRVLLAYAALPGDYTEDGQAEFEGLHESGGFDYGYSLAQVSAYTAARIAVEGLRRAGRNLTRDGLLSSLEALDGFLPGLVPPVSYGPHRRVGTLGAHIVRADLVNSRFDGETVWVSLDDDTRD